MRVKKQRERELVKSVKTYNRPDLIHLVWSEKFSDSDQREDSGAIF